MGHADMRMIMEMSGYTLKIKFKMKTIRENYSHWFGHVRKRLEYTPVMKVKVWNLIESERGKTKWMRGVANDMKN